METSLYFTARDQMSDKITTIRNSCQHFSKDADELRQRLNALDKKNAEMGVSFVDAQKKVNDAKKAYKDLNDETNRTNLEKAISEYDQLKGDMRDFAKLTKETENDLRSLQGQQDKMNNRAGGGGMLSSLAGAGMTKMFGDAASQAAGIFVSSAFGEDAGSMFSSTLSGVASGAAMGSLAGGIPGAIVGGIAGGVSGIATGAMQMFEKKDEAFKTSVQESVEGVWSQRQGDIAEGSTIAGGREQSLQSFTTLFSDKKVAENYLEEMKTMANNTPFLFDDLAQMSKVLKTYKYDVDEMIPELTNIGDAGAALGMNTPDMGMVATGLGRMRSSGKASLEYINILQERGIDAVGYLAEDKGVSNGQIYEMISKNEINGVEAARIISDAMRENFGGAMAEQAQTYFGRLSTLQGAQQEMNNAYGEGYNEERKIGMDAEANSLSGESGKRMEEANRLIGEYHASLDNLEEQYNRDARNIVMGVIDGSNIFTDEASRELAKMRDEYQRATDDQNGLKMGEVLDRAQIMAQNEYSVSEGATRERDSQLALIDAVQKDKALNEGYYITGKMFGDKLSEGIADAIKKNNPFSPSALTPTTNDLKSPRMIVTNSMMNPDGTARMIDPSVFPGRAMGVDRVPRDNYLVRLHEGEKVLTASEARQEKNLVGATVTGNNFIVREEADIDKIARAIAEQIARAQKVM